MKDLKAQNGFSLVQFLMLLVSVCVLAVTAWVAIISTQYRTPFREYFGMDPEHENFASDEIARKAMQPVISKILRELAVKVGESKEEVRRWSDKYDAAPLSDKPKYLKMLRTAVSTQKIAMENYRKARRAAAHYGFKVG